MTHFLPHIHKSHISGAVFMILLGFFLESLFPTEIAKCRISIKDRIEIFESNEDEFYSSARNFMTFWLVRLLLTLQLVYALYLAPNWRPVAVVFFSSFLLYFPIIHVLEFVKASMLDTECHWQRGNGISGHTFYYTWVLSTVHYLMHFIKNIARAKGQSISSRNILIIDLIALVLVAPSAVVTYWHGYHSLKQMFYGAIAALLWNGFLFWSFNQIPELRNPNIAKNKIKNRSKSI